MIILGIDPGYDRLGLALIDKQESQKEKLIYSTCLSSNKKDIFPLRLKTLGNQLESLLDQYSIDLIAIEDIFIANNKKTATNIASVRGMIYYLGANRDISIINLSPLEIKKIVTGYGQADKNQIINLVKKLIEIPKTVILDDEFDAIIIALAGLIKNRFQAR